MIKGKKVGRTRKQTEGETARKEEIFADAVIFGREFDGETDYSGGRSCGSDIHRRWDWKILFFGKQDHKAGV